MSINDDTGAGSDAAAIIEFAKEHASPEVLAITWPAGVHSPELLIVPQGFRTESVKKYLDEYRERPERRRGLATFDDLDSFIAHSNRMKDAHSAMFAIRDREKPRITTVLDYHELRDEETREGLPRFGEHRSLYAPQTSDEWRAWLKMDGEPMSQGDFAAFIEDRIVDVVSPPIAYAAWRAQAEATTPEGEPLPEDPDAAIRDFAEKVGGSWADAQRLMALSRGLQINADERVKQTVNLSSGEGQIQYESTHKDGAGEPVKVPNLFAIGIPVFRFGPAYRLAVRLRYRLRAGALVWFYQLYRPDVTFDHAFGEACERARTETGLPLYLGTDECRPRQAG